MADKDEQTPEDPARRKLLVQASVAVQGAIGAAIAVPLVGHLLAPLEGAPEGDAERYVDAGPTRRFRDGIPTKVTLVGDKQDAWLRASGAPLGAVWVTRKGDRYQVLSTVCPHLGCAVGWQASRERFLCPCHGSHFTAEGVRQEVGGEPNPSPRDMDPLDWRVERDHLLVRYERFRTGAADRESVRS